MALVPAEQQLLAAAFLSPASPTELRARVWGELALMLREGAISEPEYQRQKEPLVLCHLGVLCSQLAFKGYLALVPSVGGEVRYALTAHGREAVLPSEEPALKAG